LEYALAWADSKVSDKLAGGVQPKNAESEVERDSAVRELEKFGAWR
jgi:hypothetical protein